MKKIFFILALSVSVIKAQITPNTNPGNTPAPVNPVIPTQPSSGTGITPGQPNPANPVLPPTQVVPIPPDPSRPGVQPIIPTPVQTAPTTSPQINRLFQDPARTPRDPKQVDAVKKPDGSTGKYHKPKKAMSGKTFAHNKTHVKKARSKGDHAPEKTKNTDGTR